MENLTSIGALLALLGIGSLLILLNFRVAHLYRELKVEHKGMRFDAMVVSLASFAFVIGFTLLAMGPLWAGLKR